MKRLLATTLLLMPAILLAQIKIGDTGSPQASTMLVIDGGGAKGWYIGRPPHTGLAYETGHAWWLDLTFERGQGEELTRGSALITLTFYPGANY